MKQYVMYISRRYGKTLSMEKFAQQAMLDGKTIAIATIDSITCYKCKKDWLECNGNCYVKNI